jgi:hypothetical protein
VPATCIVAAVHAAADVRLRIPMRAGMRSINVAARPFAPGGIRVFCVSTTWVDAPVFDLSRLCSRPTLSGRRMGLPSTFPATGGVFFKASVAEVAAIGSTCFERNTISMIEKSPWHTSAGG